MPHGEMHRNRGIFGKALRYAPLTLTTLAALVPRELDAEIEILDEGVETLDLDNIHADLAGITCITGTAHRAYEIAAHLRARGICVVLGGPHPTLLPDEAQLHADSVVAGFAEDTWPQLLRDFAARRLQSRYTQALDYEFRNVPEPRRDLLRQDRYVTINTIQATRGCPWRCTFCVVSKALPGFHKRPVSEVIAEIERLQGDSFLLLDLSPTEDSDYIKNLFRALIPLRKHWGGLATIRIAEDPEMLRLAAQSGCFGLLIGIESVSPETLRTMGKWFNKPEDYLERIHRLHDHGIAINGCFVLGMDGDDESIFERTVEFIDRAGIDLPRLAVPTPFPNTIFYDQMRNQNRLLTQDWRYYDAQHVVFRPACMSPGRLQEGLLWTWKQAYTLPSIVRRLALSDAPKSYHALRATLPANLAYRFFASMLPEFSSKLPPVAQPLESALP